MPLGDGELSESCGRGQGQPKIIFATSHRCAEHAPTGLTSSQSCGFVFPLHESGSLWRDGEEIFLSVFLL